VCVQKDAIVIVWPDGSYADEIGVPVRTTYQAPNDLAVTFGLKPQDADPPIAP
jgi:hypothetical protein